jgi:hypothetical protein
MFPGMIFIVAEVFEQADCDAVFVGVVFEHEQAFEQISDEQVDDRWPEIEPESLNTGKRCPSGTEDGDRPSFNAFPEREQRCSEPFDIGVIPEKSPFLVDDGVYGLYGGRFCRKHVKKGNYILFVRYGDVEPRYTKCSSSKKCIRELFRTGYIEDGINIRQPEKVACGIVNERGPRIIDVFTDKAENMPRCVHGAVVSEGSVQDIPSIFLTESCW